MLGDSDSELVLVTEELEQPEIDFMVDSVYSAVEKLKKIGGKLLADPLPLSSRDSFLSYAFIFINFQ